MTELEAYLTLPEAARKYGVSRDALTRLARDGIIRAVQNEEGTAVITVSTVAAAADVIRDEIRPEQYEHLRGERIRLMEASRKYDVADQNLYRWAERRYIHILDQGFQRLELDEADVAYVVTIHRRAQELTGSPIKAGWVLKRVISKTA
jgi:predicted site-specific integrase-resolvase